MWTRCALRRGMVGSPMLIEQKKTRARRPCHEFPGISSRRPVHLKNREASAIQPAGGGVGDAVRDGCPAVDPELPRKRSMDLGEQPWHGQRRTSLLALVAQRTV